jgi:putative endonuclease
MLFYTYILASQRNGTLYIGHTDDLYRRVREHREHAIPGFTSKYNVMQLVYYEGYATRDEAFTRERRMKVWRRAWKIELIERFNPGWRDLFEDLGV